MLADPLAAGPQRPPPPAFSVSAASPRCMSGWLAAIGPGADIMPDQVGSSPLLSDSHMLAESDVAGRPETPAVVAVRTGVPLGES